MKKLFTILFSLLLYHSTFAQTKIAQSKPIQSKEDTAQILIEGYFALFGGLGQPVGDYGGTNFNNEIAGFAKAGASFEVSYSTRFSKYFGISAMFKTVSNQVNTKLLENDYNNTNPSYSFSISAKPWKLNTVMAGVFSSIPFTKSRKISAYVKAMLGESFVTSDELNYTVTTKQQNANTANGGNVYAQISASKSNALAYLFAIGFKYNISPLLCVLFQADYLSTSPEFQTTINAYNALATTNNNITPYIQKIQTLNFNLGFGVTIN